MNLYMSHVWTKATMIHPCDTWCQLSHQLVINLEPFLKQALVLCVCSTSLLKTLWEKEKLLITSNFSFSHSIFYPFGKLSAIFIKFRIVACPCTSQNQFVPELVCLLACFHIMIIMYYCIKPTLPVRYKHVLTGENRALTGENVY